MSNYVLVTGASSGIGRALALELVSRGFEVFATARSKEKLMDLQAISPKKIHVIPADISTEAGREAVLNAIPKTICLNALVNNAAVMQPSGRLRTISLEAWRQQIATNVEAPLFLTRDLVPQLKNGRVMNVTIYSSLNVTPGLAAYGISKAALNMLTEYFKEELKEDHIAVTDVLPGIVATPIQQQLPSKEQFGLRDNLEKLNGEGKLFSPEVVAKFLAWILSETSSEEYSRKRWNIHDAWHQEHWRN